MTPRRTAAAALVALSAATLTFVGSDSTSAATGQAVVPGWAYTSTASTVAQWPVLRQGASGHPVRTLQRLLRARGFSLTVDGAFGATTKSRVIAFQRSRGLTPDGVVGPRTWSALVITVKLHSVGEAVRAFQEERRFRDLRCGCSEIDGLFDSDDVAFARAFQRGVGITVDGIVGPVTWRYLVSGALAG